MTKWPQYRKRYFQNHFVVLMPENICSSLGLIKSVCALRIYLANLRCQFTRLGPICMVLLINMYVHVSFLPFIYFHCHYQFILYHFSQKWRSLISRTICTPPALISPRVPFVSHAPLSPISDLAITSPSLFGWNGRNAIIFFLSSLVGFRTIHTHENADTVYCPLGVLIFCQGICST